MSIDDYNNKILDTDTGDKTYELKNLRNLSQ